MQELAKRREQHEQQLAIIIGKNDDLLRRKDFIIARLQMACQSAGFDVTIDVASLCKVRREWRANEARRHPATVAQQMRATSSEAAMRAQDSSMQAVPSDGRWRRTMLPPRRLDKDAFAAAAAEQPGEPHEAGNGERAEAASVDQRMPGSGTCAPRANRSRCSSRQHPVLFSFLPHPSSSVLQ